MAEGSLLARINAKARDRRRKAKDEVQAIDRERERIEIEAEAMEVRKANDIDDLMRKLIAAYGEIRRLKEELADTRAALRIERRQ